ncbi:hypothetical protein HZS_4414 [Henneguya salminicola]|nr:hypothetical protein HZS_4414 [Henneguya salminicola]
MNAYDIKNFYSKNRKLSNFPKLNYTYLHNLSENSYFYKNNTFLFGQSWHFQPGAGKLCVLKYDSEKDKEY